MEVALKRSGRGPFGWKPAAIAVTAGILMLAGPAAADAEITSVFSDTATPVDCAVQTAPNAGIRFCSESPRSTVKSFDGVPIDVNVAFPPEPETGPDGPYPTVMMFHGYGGSKIGLSGMRRWLDQGYATFSHHHPRLPRVLRHGGVAPGRPGGLRGRLRQADGHALRGS